MSKIIEKDKFVMIYYENEMPDVVIKCDNRECPNYEVVWADAGNGLWIDLINYDGYWTPIDTGVDYIYRFLCKHCERGDKDEIR